MINPITDDDIKPYANEMSNSMLTLTKIDKLYGFFINDKLAGWVGVKITNSKYIYKTAFVLKEHRNKGIFNNLLSYLLAKYQDKPIEANCTPMSFGSFRRYQFEIIKEYKCGSKKLRYENKL